MIDPAMFQRAEVASTLRLLKTFAQNGPPAAEHTGAKLLALSTAAAAFVEAFEGDPEASPAALLLATGEAHAQLEALQREFDCVLDQIERLPIRLDAVAPLRGGRLPEDPRAEGADGG